MSVCAWQGSLHGPAHCGGSGRHDQEVSGAPSPVPPGLGLLGTVKVGGGWGEPAARHPAVPAHPGRAGGGRVPAPRHPAAPAGLGGSGGLPAGGSRLPPPQAVGGAPPARGLRSAAPPLSPSTPSSLVPRSPGVLPAAAARGRDPDPPPQLPARPSAGQSCVRPTD